MMEAIKRLLGMTEAQQKTIALLTKALKDKSYRVGKNEFFYDDGRHHSLYVEVTLAPNLVIALDTLFATTEFLAYNPQSPEPKAVWASEISSGKAYKMVLNHFKQILLDEKMAKETEYKNRQKEYADIAKKSV